MVAVGSRSELSRLREINEIYCLDMSEFILERALRHMSVEKLQAEAYKITRVIGDFNKLYFSDHSFDFVVFEGALHHIPLENFEAVMKEVKRVLNQRWSCHSH